MHSRAQLTRYPLSGLPALAAALLLSATSHAANNVVFPCEQVKRDLQSLEVPVGALTAERVDHAPIDRGIADDRPIASESVAPVLNLAPRVTHILRDVFELTTEELLEEASHEPSTSPLADSDPKADGAEAAKASSDKNELPRFQRQMLRTDI